MSAAARSIPPVGDATGSASRRPTRAGISSRAGAPPIRRSAGLALVADPGADPGRSGDGAEARHPVDPAPTLGSAALQPEHALGGESRPATAVQPSRDAGVPVEPLRLVPPAPVTVARMPFVLLTLGLIVGAIVGLLLLNTQINQNAFQLQKLREQQAQLDTMEQQLSKELAVKEAPGNLAAEAARQGMVPAGTPAYITLPDGRILGVPQPAGQPRR